MTSPNYEFEIYLFAQFRDFKNDFNGMIRKIIPNLFTEGNLFCGLLGIVFAFHEMLEYSALMIGIAAVLDFLDGFVARLVRGQSELGKQLDSLADMVTFGVLPGIMLFQIITACSGEYFVEMDQRELIPLACIGFLPTLFAALRLAKFNIDTEQSDEFLGLPTPAMALFVASFPIILEWQLDINFYAPPTEPVLGLLAKNLRWDGYETFVAGVLTSHWFYIVAAVLLSAIMVVRMPLLAFKFKSFGWKGNEMRFGFLILVALVITSAFVPSWRFVHFYFPAFEYTVIPIILILYLIVSVINNLLKRT